MDRKTNPNKIIDTQRDENSVLGMKQFVLIALICAQSVAFGNDPTTTTQQRLDRATQKLTKATTEVDKFYALRDAAKESFSLGKIEDARKFAKELGEVAPKYQSNWNYGNAIHDFNLVLGRIALTEGRLAEAKQHLIKAGKSPGSPQLNSFGPNMSLAKDLLNKGERVGVIEYFELCRKFWKMGEKRLDQWTQELKSGKTPDFGANLFF